MANEFKTPKGMALFDVDEMRRGQIAWLPVKVVGYDEEEAEVVVRWAENFDLEGFEPQDQSGRFTVAPSYLYVREEHHAG